MKNGSIINCAVMKNGEKTGLNYTYIQMVPNPTRIIHFAYEADNKKGDIWGNAVIPLRDKFHYILIKDINTIEVVKYNSFCRRFDHIELKDSRAIGNSIFYKDIDKITLSRISCEDTIIEQEEYHEKHDRKYNQILAIISRKFFSNTMSSVMVTDYSKKGKPDCYMVLLSENKRDNQIDPFMEIMQDGLTCINNDKGVGYAYVEQILEKGTIIGSTRFFPV